MENTLAPELAINERFKSFLANEDPQKPKYKSNHFRMFDYPDKTSSICLPPNGTIEIGDDFRDHRGWLHVITEVIEFRPHKGIFEIEAKRQRIAIVKSVVVPNM